MIKCQMITHSCLRLKNIQIFLLISGYWLGDWSPIQLNSTDPSISYHSNNRINQCDQLCSRARSERCLRSVRWSSLVWNKRAKCVNISSRNISFKKHQQFWWCLRIRDAVFLCVCVQTAFDHHVVWWSHEFCFPVIMK